MELLIEQAVPEDARQILELQKNAYTAEAKIYDDFSIPPLQQTLESFLTEFQTGLVLKALSHDTIVGSVRSYEKENTCFIGKLIVHEHHQNKGIGKMLMESIEAITRSERLELFTGVKSIKNLYLYHKLGYREFKQQVIHDKLTLVFLEKFRTVTSSGT